MIEEKVVKYFDVDLPWHGDARQETETVSISPKGLFIFDLSMGLSSKIVNKLLNYRQNFT